ncbi:MAG: hypothetical protein JSW26_10535 [Desulfobacterales bacterium]|nr:MAG: hypothetical protein JSW26_10535 [Desulfobacterales bacterium]
MKHVKHVVPVAIPIFALLWTVGLVCYAAQGSPQNVNCNAEIEWDIVPEARLIQFDCTLGTHGGQPALIFTVGVENPTQKPLRYRINIFLDDLDKAAGHLVPRKGKPPVVEPGKSATVKIPFIKLDKESKKIFVLVNTLSL